MVGVIMPGMAVAGAPGYISPFGTFGSTGTGGVGTYGLTATPSTFTFTGSNAPSGGFSTLTVLRFPEHTPAVGQRSLLPHLSYAAGTITAMLSGTGGTGKPIPSAKPTARQRSRAQTIANNGSRDERLTGQHVCGGDLLLHRRPQRLGRGRWCRSRLKRKPA